MSKILLRSLSRFVPALPVERRWRRWIHRVLRRPFDPDFLALRTLGLPEDGVFVDVGANHGFSIDAMRMFFPRSRIVAFEPNPAAAEDLAASFGGSIELHRCALGAAPGSAELYVPRYGRRLLDGLGSLSREHASGWLVGRTVGNAAVEVEAVRVAVRCLDDFDLAPDLIKIDVQGLEQDVVAGALETIRRHRPALFVEGAGTALQPLLAPLGYARHPLRKGHLLPSTWQGRNRNVLFVPARREDAGGPPRAAAAPGGAG